MTVQQFLSAALVGVGAVFFVAGTVGLLRFPDVFTRLHVLSKADNLGLGFLVAGLAIEAPRLTTIAELGAVWVLVLVSSSISAQLIANRARHAGTQPWRRP